MKTLKSLLRLALGFARPRTNSPLVDRAISIVELIYPMVRDFSRGGWSYDSFIAVLEQYNLGQDHPPYPQSVEKLKALAANRVKRYLSLRGYPESLVNLAVELAVQRVKLEAANG